MSKLHPIIAVTGSSGAGTTSVTRTFEQIFRREKVERGVRRGRRVPPLRPRRDEGEDGRGGRRGQPHFSHFGPEANLFEELEALFRDYGETGSGRCRKYLHDDAEAAPYGQPPGTFTPWEDMPAGHRPAVLRGAARRRGRPTRSTSPGTPTC